MEVDLDYSGNLCVSQEEMDFFDFLVVSPSHLHMEGFTINSKVVDESAEAHKHYYLERMDQILNADLPFEKCGLAHFTTCLVCPKEPIRVFELFTDGEYEQLLRYCRSHLQHRLALRLAFFYYHYGMGGLS